MGTNEAQIEASVVAGMPVLPLGAGEYEDYNEVIGAAPLSSPLAPLTMIVLAALNAFLNGGY